MRWLLLPLVASLLVACSAKRPITITTRPPDAAIKIDGVERGKGRVSDKLEFKNKKDTRTITVSRFGYKDHTQQINRDFKAKELNVDLKPVTARLNISIS